MASAQADFSVVREADADGRLLEQLVSRNADGAFAFGCARGMPYAMVQLNARPMAQERVTLRFRADDGAAFQLSGAVQGAGAAFQGFGARHLLRAAIGAATLQVAADDAGRLITADHETNGVLAGLYALPRLEQCFLAGHVYQPSRAGSGGFEAHCRHDPRDGVCADCPRLVFFLPGAVVTAAAGGRADFRAPGMGEAAALTAGWLTVQAGFDGGAERAFNLAPTAGGGWTPVHDHAATYRRFQDAAIVALQFPTARGESRRSVFDLATAYGRLRCH